MTNQALELGGVSLVERRTAENVNTLMFRAHVSARQMAKETGLSSPTLSRKLRVGGWTLADLVVVARYFSVGLEELTGELPTLVAWERRRRTSKGADGDPSAPSRLPRLDSNQEPSGYPLAQVVALRGPRRGEQKVKESPRVVHGVPTAR